jgi:6-phosphogluconolactonase (cycloisomerase 2 family)
MTLSGPEEPVIKNEFQVLRRTGVDARAYIGLATVVLLLAASAFGAKKPAHYVFTNNDPPGKISNSSNFYSVGAGGQLTQTAVITTGFGGIAGGYFGQNKVSALHKGNEQCVYLSDSSSGQIAAIVVQTLDVAGAFAASHSDSGKFNGVGLAMNSSYLYASYTASNTIGTFKVLAGCKLKFVGDVDANGLNGGSLDGMAVHANLLVVTYDDGSIESFNISYGEPVSNGDKQDSTGFLQGGEYPGGVDITQDGHFAIFGDVSVNTIVEVSDISSGMLTKTVVYHLGSSPNSSSVLLSPDETLLYISNTQGGQITAAFFDKTTGTLTKGCASGYLNGYDTNWAYVGTLATETTSGTGRVVYAAEFGSPGSIAIVTVTSSGGKCTLKESPKSPVIDPQSPGLLSIGVFPPRSF